MTRRRWLALGLLLIFGLVRLPVESGVEEALREAKFREARLDLEMREQLSQWSFAAALGGFRSIVATFLDLQAYGDFEQIAWGKLEKKYTVITRLQPRNDFYWEIAHWHIGTNASSHYRNWSDKFTPDLREHLAWSFEDKGRAILEDGIANNPDSAELLVMLGQFYKRDGWTDPCKAAEIFGRAMELPTAKSYVTRFYGYSLAQCPGREAEAYEHLLALFRKPENRKPSLIVALKELEQKLDIPPDHRIP
ncbi:MAG: hypothetical protein AAF514_10435 [Verrucomicrobiota bacterium]